MSGNTSMVNVVFTADLISCFIGSLVHPLMAQYITVYVFYSWKLSPGWVDYENRLDNKQTFILDSDSFFPLNDSVELDLSDTFIPSDLISMLLHQESTKCCAHTCPYQHPISRTRRVLALVGEGSVLFFSSASLDVKCCICGWGRGRVGKGIKQGKWPDKLILAYS